MMICLLYAVMFCFGQSQPENKITAIEDKKHAAAIAEVLLQLMYLHFFLNTITQKGKVWNICKKQPTRYMGRRMQNKELKLVKTLQYKHSNGYKLVLVNNSQVYTAMPQIFKLPDTEKTTNYIHNSDVFTIIAQLHAILLSSFKPTSVYHESSTYR